MSLGNALHPNSMDLFCKSLTASSNLVTPAVTFPLSINPFSYEETTTAAIITGAFTVNLLNQVSFRRIGNNVQMCIKQSDPHTTTVSSIIDFAAGTVPPDFLPYTPFNTYMVMFVDSVIGFYQLSISSDGSMGIWNVNSSNFPIGKSIQFLNTSSVGWNLN